MIAPASAGISEATEAAASPSEGQPAASSQPKHWLQDRFFVPMPDLSDETAWTISQGRSWPVWIAIMRLLHVLERKGETEAIRLDAFEGCIRHVGVNGLANTAQMTPTAVLRQLRFLERQGLIRTHQDDCTSEIDPATGRIRKNFAKAPPKVIYVTLRDYHLRPTKSQPRRTAEPNPKPSVGTAETNPTRQNLRVRNRRVSKDSDLHRGRSPLDSDRRQTADVPLGRPSAAAATGNKKPAAPPPAAAGEPEWQRKQREAENEIRAEKYAQALGMLKSEVIDLWKSDKMALKAMLDAARIDYATGKRRTDLWRERLEAVGVTPPGDSTFAIRAATTKAVSIHKEPSEASPAKSKASTDDQRNDFLGQLAVVCNEGAVVT